MGRPSSMGAIYTDTSAYRRNNRIDNAVKQLSDEMNVVKSDMSELKLHDDDFDNEFKTHLSTSDNNFSIDNVVTIDNVFVKCINKLNFTLNLINENKTEIIKAKEYASVLRPIFENKYTDNDVSIDGYVAIHTIEELNKEENKLDYMYFYEAFPENDNKREMTETILNEHRWTGNIYNEFTTLKSDNPNENIFYIIKWYKWADSVKVSFGICIPDILKPDGPWIRILAGVNITPYFPSITSIDLLPQTYKTYLGQLQDNFNKFAKAEYDPMLGTVYQFGKDKDFYNLLVVSSQDYPQWNGQLIVDSYIPGSNIDMPNIIYQINTELNRNYTGMSEGEIVIVQYAVGPTYYTGVVKMMRIDEYDGLCYQIQSININDYFPTSVSMTGDVDIQGNLNVSNYNGEKVITTDNTRKVVSFHDKVGINQYPYEVNGLLDIDNLTQQTVLDLFSTFVPYSVNSADIIPFIEYLHTKSPYYITSLFDLSGSLFDYKNQCTVFSVPIKAIVNASDISIIHTDGLGDSIVTSDFSFTRLQQIVKEVNQMLPQYASATDPSDNVFSFIEVLQTKDKKSYMTSMRAIIADADADADASEKRLLFVMTYLDVTNIMNDDSTGKPFLKTMNYVSSEMRFINYVGLLYKDLDLIDATGNYTTDTDSTIKLQNAIKNNPFFSNRFDLLPESYIFSWNWTENEKYLIMEGALQWNGKSFNDLWNSDNHVRIVIDLIHTQNNQLYANRHNSTFAVNYRWRGGRKISFTNIIRVGGNSILIGSGVDLNSILNQSMIVNGDNTISGNFFVNDSNNNNIFKVDNINKTITNTYKVGIGIEEPETILDIKDTTVNDVLNEIAAGIEQYNILNKIAKKLRDAAESSESATDFTDNTDFKQIIDDVYTELSIEQTIENFARLYEFNMETMLADDMLVLRQWLYPEWEGKKVGDIQDYVNQFALNVLKEQQQLQLNTDLIYDNSVLPGFYKHVFGWKYANRVCLEIKGKMYLLSIGTNVQNYGLRPDSNANLIAYMNQGIRGSMMTNHINVYINNINTVNVNESLNMLRRLNKEYENILLNNFILTIDITDINNTKIQGIYMNDVPPILDSQSQYLTYGDEQFVNDLSYNIIVKYKNFWIQFNNNNFYENMSVGNYNDIAYDDLYHDFDTGIRCIDISGSVFTLLCNELRIQDIIKPSLSVEGDAKITGDLLVTNKSTGTNYVTVDPDNHFMGIGTDVRFINYQDRVYTTTSNMYAGRHNVNISHDTYPVMVVERIREKALGDLSGNLETFRSYSTLTAKRRSNLYNFSDLVAKANEYSEIFKADHPNDAVSHMKYGPDISFEVCDGTDRTVELGQIGMSIDTMEDSGHLRGGFGVHVFDPQGIYDDASKSTKRSIMYVDNTSTLYVKQISLNGGVLSSDPSGTNLYWNGKKL